MRPVVPRRCKTLAADCQEERHERVRVAISKTPFELPSGDTVTVTISIGISEVHPRANDKDLKTVGDSLVARADVALYAAKSAGRDRVIVEAA